MSNRSYKVIVNGKLAREYSDSEIADTNDLLNKVANEFFSPMQNEVSIDEVINEHVVKTYSANYSSFSWDIAQF